MRRPAVLAAALLLIAAPLAAQSDTTKKAAPAAIEGRWQGVIDTPGGAQTMEAIIKKDSTGYTGMMSSPQGEMALRDITVDGDKVTFVGVANMSGTSIEIWYSFTVKGEAMNGQADVSFNGQSMSFPLNMTKVKSGG